jgi:raffinose/stachyose/melibiose transport system substrate-binding protein
MFFNKSIFDKYGLSAENLTTVDSWFEACDKLKSGGEIPVLFGNKQQWPALHYTSNFIKMQMGPERAKKLFQAEPGAKWSDPDVIEANNYLVTMIDRGYFNVGAATEDLRILQEQFAGGKGAMFGTHQHIATSIIDQGKIDADFVLWPTIPGKPGKQSEWVYWADGISIAKQVKDPDAALKVLDAFCSAEGQRASYQASPLFYAAKGATEGMTLHPLIAKMSKLYEEVTDLLPIPDIVLPPEAAAVQYDELSGVVAKQVTVEEAMANTDAAIAKALNR